MSETLLRIESVAVPDRMTLRIRWRGVRAADVVDLTGWIATGRDVLTPLLDPAVFARARVENYGAAVAWDDRDLSIDAYQLKQLPTNRSLSGRAMRAVGKSERSFRDGLR